MSDTGEQPLRGRSGLERRYVVLHHTGHGEPHYDVMIEPHPGAGRLLTWRSPVWPLVAGATLMPLGPHRRAYLEREGPVSGGRGEVRRVAEGTCSVSRSRKGVVIRFEDDGHSWLLGKTAVVYDPVVPPHRAHGAAEE